MKSGERCTSSVSSEISRRLKEETETCETADKQYHTYLPEYDVNAPSKCTRFQKLNFEGVSYKAQCQSVEAAAVCQPGCKPYMLVSKPFTFKCQGELQDFVAPMTVPSSCISA